MMFSVGKVLRASDLLACEVKLQRQCWGCVTTTICQVPFGPFSYYRPVTLYLHCLAYLGKWYMSSLLLNTASRLVVIVSQLIMIKLYTVNLPIDQIGIYFFCLAVSYSANTLIFIPLDYYQQANLRRILGLTGSVRSIFDLNLLVMLVFICCVLAITLWFYYSFRRMFFMLLLFVRYLLPCISFNHWGIR